MTSAQEYVDQTTSLVTVFADKSRLKRDFDGIDMKMKALMGMEHTAVRLSCRLLYH